MTKVALLIGVSEYETGLDPLPSAVRDVEAMQQVLAHPEMGGFAEADIMVLQNPDRQTMEDAIYTLFANRQTDDLVLFYFSGHGVVDDSYEFYFASRSTRKDQGRLVPPTAVAAGSVQRWMQQSRSQRQVIILDSCFSGAFAKGVMAKDSGSINVEQFLGGKGRAILTASTSTQYALTQEGFGLSVYTHYLVEGIRTGGADLDDDGFIGVEELHIYALSKVKESAPAMTPEFYPVKNGSRILLAKSPTDDPKLKYRKQVKALAQEDEGDFSFVDRAYLDDFQRSLGLSPDVAIAIETEELEPYRQRRAKVDRYRTVFEGAIAPQYPLTDRDRAGLQRLQKLLSLRDEDVVAIEAPILTIKQTEYEKQQAAERRAAQKQREQENLANQRLYRETLVAEAEHEYPLSASAIEDLNMLQKIYGLRDEDVLPIKKEVEAQFDQQAATYQQNLTQYEHALTDAIRQEFPFSQQIRQKLKDLHQSLELRDEDISAIETPILAIKQTEYERQQAAARQATQKKWEQEQAAQKQREREQAAQKKWEQEQAAQKKWEQEQAAQKQREQEQAAQKQREQEQAAQKQREQEQAAQRTQSVSPPPTSHVSSTLTRQQFLKWTVFSGGGLAVALIGNQMTQSQKTPEMSPNQGTSAKPVSLQLLTSKIEIVTVDYRGRIVKRVPAQAKYVKEELGNKVAIEMVVIPAGEFLMGFADNDKPVLDIAKPQHRVEMPEFWIGKFAVTQAQWRQVAGLPKVRVDLNPDPSKFKGASRPVEMVSWEEAVEFCDRLSQKTIKPYRLPTEAEWEYTCRAGSTTPFYFGETITPELVNCDGTKPHGKALKGKFRKQTTDVGEFPPNAFGLCDMHGNVWEWCADFWHENYNGAPTDGSAWTTNQIIEYHIIRGGSWSNDPMVCRSAYRNSSDPVKAYNFIGFRVACSFSSTLL